MSDQLQHVRGATPDLPDEQPPYTIPPSNHPTMGKSVQLSPLQKWAARASDSQFNAIAGAIGGFTSGVVTCPLDVIKTKLQAQGGILAADRAGAAAHPRLYNGLFGTADVIWREEGIRGMYRGLGPIVMGYLPTWAVWFTVYNKTKVYLSQYHGELIRVGARLRR